WSSSTWRTTPTAVIWTRRTTWTPTLRCGTSSWRPRWTRWSHATSSSEWPPSSPEVAARGASQKRHGAFVNWRKSSYSPNNSNFVEVGAGEELRGIRDSKLGERSPVLVFGAAAFGGFLDGVRAGRFAG